MVFRPYPQVIQRFFNTNWFGPPPRVTGGSAWPRIDHPASGLPRATRRALRTRFRFGSAISGLTLRARGDSQAHYAKGMRSPHRGLPQSAGAWFQGLFHSLRKGSFHLSLAVLVHYRSTASIQPCGMGPTDSDGVSRVPPYLGSGTGARRFAHGAVTRRGPTFQTVAPAPRSRSCRPATPADRSAGLGFVRVRSPLLAESLLISSPRGTEMFHFPRYRLRALFDSHADGALARAGLLHSDTHGSKAACASPWTFAACRVLPRPPSPRHPSCARKAWPPENVRRPLPCVAFHLARLDRLQ